MRVEIRIPDEKYDRLNDIAKERKFKNLEDLLQTNIDFLPKLDNTKSQILLEHSHVTAITKANGGGIVKTANDIQHIVENALRLSVDGVKVELTLEDANALKEQWQSSGIKDYSEYLAAVVNESVYLYLWGSTRGVLSR